jgi:uncharacterized protein
LLGPKYCSRELCAASCAQVQRRTLLTNFDSNDDMEAGLKVLQRYADAPISLADPCLVRMTEWLSEAIVLTTDSDCRIYQRHHQQAIPCVMPS